LKTLFNIVYNWAMFDASLPEFTIPAVQSLYASILADPDNNGPRLAFASWLDGQTDAASRERAEFIRLQCRVAEIDEERQEPERRFREIRARHPIAGLSEGWEDWTASGDKAEFERLKAELAAIDAMRQVPQDQANNLLSRYRASWLSPIADIGSRRKRLSWEGHDAGTDDWRFCRGFLARWHTSAAHFLEYAETVFALIPLTELSLYHTDLKDDDVQRLAGSPHLARLRVLILNTNYIRSPAAIALATSPHVVNLTGLFMAGTLIEGDGADALADSPYLRRLRELDLGNTFVDADYECTARLRRRFGPGVVASRNDD
jgi:uncharacterized protein (TIGR02996 family)